jgi:hypothetical protein
LSDNPSAGEVALSAGVERAIPTVYLWLWGCYAVLAVAAQFLMPAPWRAGPMRMRTNWVLNITTVVTLIIFMGTNFDQVVNGEAIGYREGGGYTYQHGGSTRDIAAEDARQITARIIRDRETAIYKTWNMAAALSYLALGAYALWWIVERPEAEPVETEFSVTSLMRHLKGEPAEEPKIERETMPSENALSREPTQEKISWR